MLSFSVVVGLVWIVCVKNNRDSSFFLSCKVFVKRLQQLFIQRCKGNFTWVVRRDKNGKRTFSTCSSSKTEKMTIRSITINRPNNFFLCKIYLICQESGSMCLFLDSMFQNHGFITTYYCNYGNFPLCSYLKFRLSLYSLQISNFVQLT